MKKPNNTRQKIWVRSLTLGDGFNLITGENSNIGFIALAPNKPKIKRFDDSANEYTGEPLPFTIEREFKTTNDIFIEQLIGRK